MLDFNAHALCSRSPGMRRRDFIRVGALTATGLTLADYLQLQAHGKTTEGKAKSVIQLWMAGGPSHIDTFDPKPNTGEAYSGPLDQSVETNISGIRIGQLLPKLAKQADKYAILRGMKHPSNGHETASYLMQTGSMPNGNLVYPTLGAVVALRKGYEANPARALPPYVAIPKSIGRISEEGFLGTRYKAFATGGNPNSKSFAVNGIVPPRGMTEQRLAGRRRLLKSVGELTPSKFTAPPTEAMNEYQVRAYELILGEAKQAFDISREPDAVRDRYGRTTFGQSCLLARRLVEHGVPFITVNLGGWDTHKNHFNTMEKKLPDLDQGFATLLEDLAERGLLDTTIVTWFGEFGRTPKVQWAPPWNGGRHHYCHAFSAVVAGGGFKGGTVIGETDAHAEKVIKRPTYPWDLSASMYQLLGIDPDGLLPHPRGCMARVTPKPDKDTPSGGLLTELM